MAQFRNSALAYQSGSEGIIWTGVGERLFKEVQHAAFGIKNRVKVTDTLEHFLELTSIRFIENHS
jgi:hypothetical protein